MNALLTVLALLLSATILFIVPASGGSALLVCVLVALPAGLFISRTGSDKKFLLQLFLCGLLVRVALGTVIYVLSLQDFFGGDAYTYDIFGNALLKVWQGDKSYNYLVNMFVGNAGGSGWGMIYLVAVVYGIAGRNMLAVQLLNSVLGAATAPVIFLCARHIYKNYRVARIAGLAAAFYPSLVLWSSQALKDGPIVFFLAVSILATLRLSEKVSLGSLLMLLGALLALLSLRFYIFYMIVAAIVGAFLIGMRQASARGIVQQSIVILLLGLSLTYLGVLRTASVQFETYGNLEMLQNSRLNLQQTANTGFGKDVDLSTTSGAISTIPSGLAYLLFAPFPWQLGSLRQSITLPEMVVWWVSFPFLVLGFWFTVKYRLRQTLPIIIFTIMLTFAYSIFQGNVGTAYRQRSQLLVFYFIFASVGYEILKERREDRKHQALLSKQAAMLTGRRPVS